MFDFGDIALLSIFSNDGNSGGGRNSLLGISNAERRRRNREFESGNYNMSAQMRYEGKYGDFNLFKIMDALHKDYPGMNTFNANKIAEMAIAKRRMEEETPYKYYVDPDYRFINLEKYASDDFKNTDEENIYNSISMETW